MQSIHAKQLSGVTLPDQCIGLKEKTPATARPGVRIKSLAVTYFRTGKPRTIIGAEQFHFRVRNGVGWFPLAMAARQTGHSLSARFKLRAHSRLHTGVALSLLALAISLLSSERPHLESDLGNGLSQLHPGPLGVIWSSLTVN